MKKLILFACSFSMVYSLGAQLRAEHLWQDRLLLLFASSRENDAFQRQFDLLTAKEQEVTERDLKIYRIFPGQSQHPDGKALPQSFSEQLYSKYAIKPGGGFTILLIGKDGTEKLRAEEVVDPKRIFRLIDSMPMRQREMKERQ